MERLAALLRTALDPDVSEAARREACEQLKNINERTLRELALDSDWRQILNILSGNAPELELARAADSTDDSAPWLETARPSDLVIPLTRVSVLEIYTHDLRWLTRDDYRLEPLVATSKPQRGLRPSERVAICASAVPHPPVADEAVVRRLPWTMLNHGALLQLLWETWPERQDLLRAFLEESIGGRADLGIPPRLATKIEENLSESSELQEWFDSLAMALDHMIEAEFFDFLSVEQLVGHHLRLRLKIAEAVRQAEIMNTPMVAVTELYATVRLLRVAARKDLLRAWHEGSGQIPAVVQIYDLMNKKNDCIFDRAYRAVLRQPDTATLARLTDGERQTLALVRELRNRSGQQSGFLSHSDDPF